MVMLCRSINADDLPLILKANPNKYIGEIKLDGDRLRLRSQNGIITLTNRKENNVTERYPELQSLNLPDCFLDGEICVMVDGKSKFNGGIDKRSHCTTESSILSAMKDFPVTFVIFDILEKDGLNVKHLALTERRKLLNGLLLNSDVCRLVRQSTNPLELWDEMVKTGEEGIILKDKNSPYLEKRRSGFWNKVKNIKEKDLLFINYSVHNKGVRVETREGIAITVNGFQAENVRKLIDDNGHAVITIRHLGETDTGKYRQPVFNKIV